MKKTLELTRRKKPVLELTKKAKPVLELTKRKLPQYIPREPGLRPAIAKRLSRSKYS